MFDLLHLSRVGINWVNQLREYQKLLNEEPMEILGNRSPFEVFYGRESNAVTHRVPGGHYCQENCRNSTTHSGNITPTFRDYKKNDERVRAMRSKVRDTSKLWSERYIRRSMKRYPPSIYAIGERVLIRFPFSKKLVLEHQHGASLSRAGS